MAFGFVLGLFATRLFGPENLLWPICFAILGSIIGAMIDWSKEFDNEMKSNSKPHEVLHSNLPQESSLPELNEENLNEMLTKAFEELNTLCNNWQNLQDWEKFKYDYNKYYLSIKKILRRNIFQTISHKNGQALKMASDFAFCYANLDSIERYSKLYPCTDDITIFENYLDHHKADCFEKQMQSISKIAKKIEKKNIGKFLDVFKPLGVYIELYEEFKNSKYVITRHDLYVNEHLKSDQEFFDNCQEYPLDHQQRKAILGMEDNTLVIASAGSGKTSTIIGKAKYLMEKCNVNPKDILILTYTRKAAEELKSRLGSKDVICSTFNAYALSLITEFTMEKPNEVKKDLMLNLFYEQLRDNSDFKKAIVHYCTELSSGMKLEHEYDSAEEYYKDRKKYGIECKFPDRNGNRIFTKSEEERRICEWLSMHGIEFEYERAYELPTAIKEHKQYQPDFTIFYKEPKTGEEKKLYFEHFGIDSKGNVPIWFGTNHNDLDQSKTAKGKRWKEANKKYKEGIKWKKKTHRNNGTDLIYTTSAMFLDKNIWNCLEKELGKYGINVDEQPVDKLYQELVERDKGLEKSIFRLIEQFVTLQKSNAIRYDRLLGDAKKKKDLRSTYIITNIMKPFSEKYEERLKKEGRIDFTDMLIKATDILNKKFDWISVDGYRNITSDPYNFHKAIGILYNGQKEKRYFDYILVDEFQDISLDRYNFLKALRTDSGKKFTKLFCVGDDWQSIYRFSGSNMSLFYEFEKYFGYTEHYKIETTYRFNDPAISKSSEFIQKNPFQIKKEVKEFSKMKRLGNTQTVTDIDFYGYETESEEKANIEKIISGLPFDQTILILGRYNHDAKSLGFPFDPKKAKEEISVNLAGRDVKFMSVHSAKGLEADHVFLLNCNQGRMGFPSLIEDDPVLAFVLSDADKYEYAEERRLFYVAITRAKRKTYVFYNKQNPSCFVEEMNSNMSKEYIPCPHCKQGHLVDFWHGRGKNGEISIGLRCNNVKANCPHVEFMGFKEYQTIRLRFGLSKAFEYTNKNISNLPDVPDEFWEELSRHYPIIPVGILIEEGEEYEEDDEDLNWKSLQNSIPPEE